MKKLKHLLTHPPDIKIKGVKVKAWPVPKKQHLDRMVEAIEEHKKSRKRMRDKAEEYYNG